MRKRKKLKLRPLPKIILLILTVIVILICGVSACMRHKKTPATYEQTYGLSRKQLDFIEKLGSSAQKNYSKYGILPSMTIAQAILESGWGESELSALYYNFFGMRADSTYTGEYVTLRTGEEIDGVMIKMDGDFRAYHSFDEGIEGYYQFITGYERYSNLIWETDYRTACYKIKEDGWATASNYSECLIDIIESYDLTRFDCTE
ncbi:MAG: glycoside hydrolase family 73 protein [Ruminococcus flavefaciens]|nr:glycoside hydrolase family 73 protein [Ruminococcus flavefaciens]